MKITWKKSLLSITKLDLWQNVSKPQFSKWGLRNYLFSSFFSHFWFLWKNYPNYFQQQVEDDTQILILKHHHNFCIANKKHIGYFIVLFLPFLFCFCYCIILADFSIFFFLIKELFFIVLFRYLYCSLLYSFGMKLFCTVFFWYFLYCILLVIKLFFIVFFW